MATEFRTSLPEDTVGFATPTEPALPRDPAVELNPNTPEGDASDSSVPPAGEESAAQLAGDYTDDDAVYIDQILWPNPDEIGIPDDADFEHARDINVTRDDLSRPTTRLITTVQPVGPPANFPQPSLLVPADSFRQKLFIRGNTGIGAAPAASQPFVLAGTFDECFFQGTSIPALSSSDPPMDWTGHTGAVWVYAPLSTANFYVAAWGMTGPAPILADSQGVHKPGDKDNG